MRSATDSTTPVLCVMNGSDTPISRCKSFRRLRLCACTDTSSANAGTTQITEDPLRPFVAGVTMMWSLVLAGLLRPLAGQGRGLPAACRLKPSLGTASRHAHQPTLTISTGCS